MSLCRHCEKASATRPRGLCWVCFYRPDVRARYPAGWRSNRDDAVHEVAAYLELIAALLYPLRPSELSDAEWHRLLVALPARSRRVVILHGLMGKPFAEVGERLEITPARVDQIWRATLPKLRGPLAAACGEGWAG